jgi:hypothetical protein
MSKNIFRDIKRGIYLKEKERDICFYYFNTPTEKQIAENFLKEGDNSNIRYFRANKAFIYKFTDNSKIDIIKGINIIIDKDKHKIYNPSDKEIELYESIYKDFRKAVKDKIREIRINNIINKFEPLAILIMQLETYYILYKNDMSGTIMSYAHSIMYTPFRKKPIYYINYLTSYRHFDIQNNIKDTIINDVFSFISGTSQLMLNVYNYNNKKDICIIAEKTGKYNINLFIRTYAKINGKLDIKKNATFINKKNNKNIIKELSEFVTNNIEE